MSVVHAEGVTPGRRAFAEDAAIARVVARLSAEYVLRILQLTIQTFGDIRAGLVVQAIGTANTAHFDARQNWGFSVVGPNLTFPDETRRPVSVARIAESLGLPFETTRRLVHRLIDQGACARVEGGVIVRAATAQRPDIASAVRVNVGYLRRFVRDLGAVGLMEAALLDRTLLADEAVQYSFAAHVVARLSAQYLLRVCHLLVEVYGDVRYGIVAETILAANTAHLDTRTGEGWRYLGIDDTLPDDLRRPISIAGLADSAGLPFETVRRYVRRLTEAGACMKVEGGVIVPRAVQERPAAVSGTLANVGYVRRFVRDLHAVVAELPSGSRPH